MWYERLLITVTTVIRGRKSFEGHPISILGEETWGPLGLKIHQTMRALSALSSDHGVRWLIIVRGVTRPRLSARTRCTYRLEPTMPRVQGVHVLNDKWNAEYDWGQVLGNP